MLTQRQRELIDLYVAAYPHLAELKEQAGLTGEYKPLGDNMSRLAYPPGINGRDALELGRIGLRP